MIGRIFSWLASGVLDRVLQTVDRKIENEADRQVLRKEVIEAYIKADTETRQIAMQSRMFWHVWGLFAVPLGCWWALVMFDTAFPFVSMEVPDLPSSVKPWANSIFNSIFGSGAAVGAAQAISNAIRGRR